MANGLLNQIYAPSPRQRIEYEERRNPAFGLINQHAIDRGSIRPTYSNAVTETIGSLLEPFMHQENASPLDFRRWTGSFATPAVKAMRPGEEPTALEYAFSGIPFAPNVGLIGTAVKAAIPAARSGIKSAAGLLNQYEMPPVETATLGMNRIPLPRRRQEPTLSERMIVRDAVGNLRRKERSLGTFGEPQQRIVLEANGERMVVGDINFDDWAERVGTMNSNDIADYRKWYKVASEEFKKVFGNKEGDKYMLGWLLGNQNESPAGAFRSLLRAEEKGRGVHQPFKAGLGETKIIQALGDDPITSGAAAKLFDFVDSAEGKRLRTFMGNNQRGGSPAVMDVHSTRDMGFVDETFHNWLRNKFGDQADQVLIDVKSAVKKPQYERGSEKMNRFAEEANRRGFMGGGWTAAEIQAVGWKYMGDKVGGGVQTIPEAIQSNIRRISSELAFAVGSPFDQAFGQTFRNMPYNDQRWLTDHVYRSTLPRLMDAVGVRGVANIAGGKYGGVTPPSIQLDAFASPERAADMADTMGFVFQQDEVIRARPLGGGDTVSLNVTLQGNPTFDQAMQFADGITQSLDIGTWGGRMMGPPTRQQGLLVPDVTAPGFYYMPETRTITLFLNRQPRITKTGKVSKVTEGTGALSNRIQSDIEQVLQTIGKKYNIRGDYNIFNSEAAWHGEEGHWAKGGRGEVFQRGLGERGRSDLQAGLDNSAQHVGEKTREGIQILESGNAPRYQRRPIKGPQRLSPIDEKTGLLAGFFMPK